MSDHEPDSAPPEPNVPGPDADVPQNAGRLTDDQVRLFRDNENEPPEEPA